MKYGANPMCADTEGNIPAHLAAKWCSREENYADYKLVMTPLIQVFFLHRFKNLISILGGTKQFDSGEQKRRNCATISR